LSLWQRTIEKVQHKAGEKEEMRTKKKIKKIPRQNT
jgi:hypothetical protein